MAGNFSKVVAYKIWSLLEERRAILYDDRKVFYVWTLADRVLVIFDPAMVDIGKLSQDFAHRLSTRLNGRLVVRTNTRGLFFQVDPQIPQIVDLTAKPLNLSEQPGPFHMGIGSTAQGDLWISLLDGDSFFVTGIRNGGKSGELHGMIQSLLHGEQTLVYAWDYKENAEYMRYVGRKNFTLLPKNGLQKGLETIQQEATQRMRKMAMSGHPNIISYTADAESKDYMPPIALFIDEVAEVEDQSLLLRQVKVNRAAGVYPIFATNDPSKSAVIAKSNLGTRISFKVVSTPDSMMGLGQPGANHLPNIRGRGMIVHDGRVIEFQSFTVEYPKPTAEGMRWLEEQAHVQEETLPSKPVVATEAEDARVLTMIADGKSDSAIVREVWNVTGGGRYSRLAEHVKSLRSTSSSSTSGRGKPFLGLEAAG